MWSGESFLVAGLFLLASLPFVRAVWRSESSSGRNLTLGAWLVVAIALLAAITWYPPPITAAVPVTDRPTESLDGGYVTSRACQACHPDQYASWADSYHATMTQLATPETVRAPFDGREVTAHGGRYRLFREGDEFRVAIDDPQTGKSVRRIVMITGSHHFQFYWYATDEEHRPALLPYCYRLVDEERWMPLDAAVITPPHMQQEEDTGRWNRVCNKCHSTYTRPRFDEDDPTSMETVFGELGIGCEACHGPGAEHIAANRDPNRRYALHASDDEGDPTIVNPARLDARRSAQVCGQCHGVNSFPSDEHRARWREEGFSYRPGDELREHMLKGPKGLDKFWSDGMIRVSGRENSGTLESPCAKAEEMDCLSCHTMHQKRDDLRPRKEWADDQLAPGMRGNRACTQCHDGFEGRALTAHTYHDESSSGSNCYNCHMPHTTYGLLKGIRTHEVHSPDVMQTTLTGRPNGCNGCHLDQTLEWAADHLEEWYGIDKPDLTEDERTIAASLLWALRGDAGQRALVVAAMRREDARKASGTEWMTPPLSILMVDPYHAIRYQAMHAMRLQPEGAEIDYDFDDPGPKRDEESRRALRAWSARFERNRQIARPELLIGPDGRLMGEVYNRLLEQRDNSDVILNE